jgi:hypothetical protein
MELHAVPEIKPELVFAQALRERIPKTAGRQVALLLGCLFSLSCISLLGEGLAHLRIFLRLAALNILVGAFTPERFARVFLIVEACAIFGLLGYQFFQLHERHAS